MPCLPPQTPFIIFDVYHLVTRLAGKNVRLRFHHCLLVMVDYAQSTVADFSKNRLSTASSATLAKMEPLSLRVNFSWTLIGNVVYAGCQWGMLVVLAKLGSPEMVGQFALGLAITAPVFMFANLQLRAVQATDAKQKYLFGDYIGLRIITTSISLVAILGIVLLAGYRPETVLIFLLLGLARAFESISDVFYGLLQRHERMDRIAKSMMIKGPLSLAGLSLGVYLSGAVIWGVVGLAVAWACILFAYDVRSGILIINSNSKKINKNSSLIKDGLNPHWMAGRLLKLTWLALPLGLVMMLISLNTNIPRYFIKHYLGERELGIFAAMAYIIVAGAQVVQALGQSASPRLAKYYAAGKRSEFRALIFKLISIGIVLGAVGIIIALLAGREILTLLYRSEYAQYGDTFILLMVAAGVTYVSSFLGYGMTAARYFRAQALLFALVSVSTAAFCFLLIPGRGLVGAALALLFGLMVQVGASAVIMIHALQQNRSSING